MSSQDNLPYLLNESPEFPDPRECLSQPEGLLAVGGDLSRERLISAYRQGIFPWYSELEPILWWSPNPRAVIYPDDVHISKSLRKLLRQKHYRTFINRDFEKVIQNCANRGVLEGTWITDEMQSAYIALHEIDLAHCVSVYDQEDNLIGGLYGVSLGKFFFGESMFSRAPNASKVALVTLARYLGELGFLMIDCQLPNSHLLSMGAVKLDREIFLNQLKQWVDWQQPEGIWLERELTNSLCMDGF